MFFIIQWSQSIIIFPYSHTIFKSSHWTLINMVHNHFILATVIKRKTLCDILRHFQARFYFLIWILFSFFLPSGMTMIKFLVIRSVMPGRAVSGKFPQDSLKSGPCCCQDQPHSLNLKRATLFRSNLKWIFNYPPLTHSSEIVTLLWAIALCGVIQCSGFRRLVRICQRSVHYRSLS